METPQQPNKTICQGIKARNAIKLGSLLLFCFLSCVAQKGPGNKDETLIATIMLAKNTNGQVWCLNASNDNSDVIRMLHDLSSCQGNVCDSLLQSNGIDSKDFLTVIKPDLKFLVTQKANSAWSAAVLCKKTGISDQAISISKPVYTRDGRYALTEIQQPTRAWIGIYEYKNNVWIAYKMIAPKLVSPRIPMK